MKLNNLFEYSLESLLYKGSRLFFLLLGIY
nr:MAG TPA_asm: hypothetical protein [Caudoviricetes sp.]